MYVQHLVLFTYAHTVIRKYYSIKIKIAHSEIGVLLFIYYFRIPIN